MDYSKYKSLKKGGAKKAAETFSATRNQKPSDRLIKIISEVQPDEPSSVKKDQKKIARDIEA
jgi:hypothetical protein